jgi:hypothetical protein
MVSFSTLLSRSSRSDTEANVVSSTATPLCHVLSRLHALLVAFSLGFICLSCNLLNCNLERHAVPWDASSCVVLHEAGDKGMLKHVLLLQLFSVFLSPLFHFTTSSSTISPQHCCFHGWVASWRTLLTFWHASFCNCKSCQHSLWADEHSLEHL